MYKKPLLRIPISLDRYALRRSQYWSRSRFERYTEYRIRALLERAIKVPYWKALFDRHKIPTRTFSMKDISRIPVSSKQDFLQENVAFWTDRRLLSESYTDRTSGSTGEPFTFYVDRSWELRSFGICDRFIRRAAGGRRYQVISLRGRPKLGLAMISHVLFYVRNFNTVRYRIDALKRTCDSFGKGVVLYSFPSIFSELARRVAEAKVVLPIRAVVTGGEAISDMDRVKIERTLGAPLVATYATRELGWLAFECEKHALHLNEEWAYVEIVDEKGIPLPVGREGTVVATVFENQVMPFIRYNTGDRGRFTGEQCSCGRTLRVLQVRGREVELITFSDGRAISALDLVPILDRFQGSVRQYQIVRTGEFDFTVRVVAGPMFEKQRERMERALARTLHHRAAIRWELVEEIAPDTSGKRHSYTSHISSAHNVPC